jgi:hypothetical protein
MLIERLRQIAPVAGTFEHVQQLIPAPGAGVDRQLR